MFVKINSCANVGLDCALVNVEADISERQQSAFIIVGLPDIAIQEARERVRFAIVNSGFDFPRGKVAVNLAPADLKKEGPSYDLPIAICILRATNQITADLSDSIFIGELALNGEVRPINGVLPIAIFAKEKGIKNLFIPSENAAEAALISDINIFPVVSFNHMILHLQGIQKITPEPHNILSLSQPQTFETDMAHVQGQEHAKRALEIAAAGGHNILFYGPPGSGKTLMARTMPTILPPMETEEMLEITKIYSIANLLTKENPVIMQRPFRSPHHTSSGAALVGGGKIPRPGEISLAHRGVLFLDEFPEFPRAVIENLRQPLEDGIISISRAQGTLTFPARFTLIASQNPCPCGYYNDPEKNCVCSAGQILKYQKKISGPIIDRIDLHVDVPRINFEKMQENRDNESSAQIRQRVIAARKIQCERFSDSNIIYNGEMSPIQIKRFCELDATSIELLKSAVNRLHLSARSFHRILKLARTIADLSGNENINSNNIAEALQYRPKN
ncbi:YifB family Mg chelatase-like AAA ATPase [Patescibacteria group bacterium]|nr:YifB family Mg chelatase-like AAA ATPase [Patescibacteria group bacterium]